MGRGWRVFPHTRHAAGGRLGVALALVAFVSPAPAASQAPAPVDARRAMSLERAVRHVATEVDVVEALRAARVLTTGTFELTCAIGLFIPDEGKYRWWEPLLGAGCLAAAAGLYVSNGLALDRLARREDAWERVRRFEAAAADGLDVEEAAAFEAELEAAARATRVTRGVGVAIGAASWVTGAVLAWLTASGRIEEGLGTTVSIAAFVTGTLGLSLAWVESPAERAVRTHRRLGLGAERGSPAWRLTPWAGAHGGGAVLEARW